jgi:hypothetical protein
MPEHEKMRIWGLYRLEACAKSENPRAFVGIIGLFGYPKRKILGMRFQGFLIN